MSNRKTSPITKNIEVGKFYLIFDGSRTGHPGFVVWKDDEKNRYLIIKFDSDKKGDTPKKNRGVRHISELKHIIGGNIVRSYAKNRPLLCKRRDIGKEFSDLKIHPDDMKLITKISKAKKQYSRSIKK